VAGISLTSALPDSPLELLLPAEDAHQEIIGRSISSHGAPSPRTPSMQHPVHDTWPSPQSATISRSLTLVRAVIACFDRDEPVGSALRFPSRPDRGDNPGHCHLADQFGGCRTISWAIRALATGHHDGRATLVSLCRSASIGTIVTHSDRCPFLGRKHHNSRYRRRRPGSRTFPWSATG